MSLLLGINCLFSTYISKGKPLEFYNMSRYKITDFKIFLIFNCLFSVDFEIGSFRNQFECDKCGKCYKHKENMIRHRNRECGVEPAFNCDLCPFRTKRKESLKLHLMSKHERTLDSLLRPQADKQIYQ